MPTLLPRQSESESGGESDDPADVTTGVEAMPNGMGTGDGDTKEDEADEMIAVDHEESVDRDARLSRDTDDDDEEDFAEDDGRFRGIGADDSSDEYAEDGRSDGFPSSSEEADDKDGDSSDDVVMKSVVRKSRRGSKADDYHFIEDPKTWNRNCIRRTFGTRKQTETKANESVVRTVLKQIYCIMILAGHPASVRFDRAKDHLEHIFARLRVAMIERCSATKLKAGRSEPWLFLTDTITLDGAIDEDRTLQLLFALNPSSAMNKTNYQKAMEFPKPKEWVEIEENYKWALEKWLTMREGMAAKKTPELITLLRSPVALNFLFLYSNMMGSDFLVYTDDDRDKVTKMESLKVSLPANYNLRAYWASLSQHRSWTNCVAFYTYLFQYGLNLDYRDYLRKNDAKKYDEAEVTSIFGFSDLKEEWHAQLTLRQMIKIHLFVLEFFGPIATTLFDYEKANAFWRIYCGLTLKDLRKFLGAVALYSIYVGSLFDLPIGAEEFHDSKDRWGKFQHIWANHGKPEFTKFGAEAKDIPSLICALFCIPATTKGCTMSVKQPPFPRMMLGGSVVKTKHLKTWWAFEIHTADLAKTGLTIFDLAKTPDAFAIPINFRAVQEVFFGEASDVFFDLVNCQSWGGEEKYVNGIPCVHDLFQIGAERWRRIEVDPGIYEGRDYYCHARATVLARLDADLELETPVASGDGLKWEIDGWRDLANGITDEGMGKYLRCFMHWSKSLMGTGCPNYSYTGGPERMNAFPEKTAKYNLTILAPEKPPRRGRRSRSKADVAVPRGDRNTARDVSPYAPSDSEVNSAGTLRKSKARKAKTPEGRAQHLANIGVSCSEPEDDLDEAEMDKTDVKMGHRLLSVRSRRQFPTLVLNDLVCLYDQHNLPVDFELVAYGANLRSRCAKLDIQSIWNGKLATVEKMVTHPPTPATLSPVILKIWTDILRKNPIFEWATLTEEKAQKIKSLVKAKNKTDLIYDEMTSALPVPFLRFLDNLMVTRSLTKETINHNARWLNALWEYSGPYDSLAKTAMNINLYKRWIGEEQTAHLTLKTRDSLWMCYSARFTQAVVFNHYGIAMGIGRTRIEGFAGLISEVLGHFSARHVLKTINKRNTLGTFALIDTAFSRVSLADLTRVLSANAAGRNPHWETMKWDPEDHEGQDLEEYARLLMVDLSDNAIETMMMNLEMTAAAAVPLDYLIYLLLSEVARWARLHNMATQMDYSDETYQFGGFYFTLKCIYAELKKKGEVIAPDDDIKLKTVPEQHEATCPNRLNDSCFCFCVPEWSEGVDPAQQWFNTVLKACELAINWIKLDKTWLSRLTEYQAHLNKPDQLFFADPKGLMREGLLGEVKMAIDGRAEEMMDLTKLRPMATVFLNIPVKTEASLRAEMKDHTLELSVDDLAKDTLTFNAEVLTMLNLMVTNQPEAWELFSQANTRYWGLCSQDLQWVYSWMSVRPKMVKPRDPKRWNFHDDRYVKNPFCLFASTRTILNDIAHELGEYYAAMIAVEMAAHKDDQKEELVEMDFDALAFNYYSVTSPICKGTTMPKLKIFAKNVLMVANTGMAMTDSAILAPLMSYTMTLKTDDGKTREKVPSILVSPSALAKTGASEVMMEPFRPQSHWLWANQTWRHQMTEIGSWIGGHVGRRWDRKGHMAQRMSIAEIRRLSANWRAITEDEVSELLDGRVFVTKAGFAGEPEPANLLDHEILSVHDWANVNPHLGFHGRGRELNTFGRLTHHRFVVSGVILAKSKPFELTRETLTHVITRHTCTPRDDGGFILKPTLSRLFEELGNTGQADPHHTFFRDQFAQYGAFNAHNNIWMHLERIAPVLVDGRLKTWCDELEHYHDSLWRVSPYAVFMVDGVEPPFLMLKETGVSINLFVSFIRRAKPKPLSYHCFFERETASFIVSGLRKLKKSRIAVKEEPRVCIDSSGNRTLIRQKTFAGLDETEIDLNWNGLNWAANGMMALVMKQNMNYYLKRTNFTLRGIWAEFKRHKAKVIRDNGQFVPDCKTWRDWPTHEPEKYRERFTEEFKLFKTAMASGTAKFADVEIKKTGPSKIVDVEMTKTAPSKDDDVEMTKTGMADDIIENADSGADFSRGGRGLSYSGAGLSRSGPGLADFPSSLFGNTDEREAKTTLDEKTATDDSPSTAQGATIDLTVESSSMTLSKKETKTVEEHSSESAIVSKTAVDSSVSQPEQSKLRTYSKRKTSSKGTPKKSKRGVSDRVSKMLAEVSSPRRSTRIRTRISSSSSSGTRRKARIGQTGESRRKSETPKKSPRRSARVASRASGESRSSTSRRSRRGEDESHSNFNRRKSRKRSRSRSTSKEKKSGDGRGSKKRHKRR
jgi:hypothetical protein